MAVSNDWISAKNVGKFVKNVDSAMKIVKGATTFVAPVVKNFTKQTPLGKFVTIGASLASATTAYLAYDEIKDGSASKFWKKQLGVSDGALPTSHSSVSSTGVVPSIDEPISKLIEDVNKNTLAANNAIDASNKIIKSNQSIVDSINNTLGQKFASAPLLQNQIYVKSSIDSIAEKMGEQTEAIASVLQVFDAQMTVLNGTLMTIAKNAQVNTQIQKNISEDYGSADFFYAFTPTPEYWHNVDQADYQYNLDLVGSPNFVWVSPSSRYASEEISLIDSMQGNSTKSDIRKAIEAFRASKVSSTIRALLGVTLVNAQNSSLEAQKAQTEYYKVATPAVQSQLFAQSAQRVATESVASTLSNVIAPALESFAPELSRIAESATSAKVVSDFAQTQIEVKDLDGDVVAITSPMALEASKNASIARGETDTNKIGGDLISELEDIFGGESMNLLKIFSYFPLTDSISNLTEDDNSSFETALNAWKGANE